MIQRKQTIYLLLALAALIVCLCLPIGKTAVSPSVGGIVVYYNLGAYLGNSFTPHPVPFVDLVIAGTIALVTIFLYKKRKVQMKLCVLDIILCLLWYGWYIAMVLTVDGMNVAFGACLPLVAVIFLFMARRGVKADEELIKSMDRIR